MKIIPILILAFSSILHGYNKNATVDSYEAEYPGLNVAVHSVFIKCYANHWKGFAQTKLKDSPYLTASMTCGGFWNKFLEETKNPYIADQKPSPFHIGVHWEDSLTIIDVPFFIWSQMLSDLLNESADNPLRKSK